MNSGNSGAPDHGQWLITGGGGYLGSLFPFGVKLTHEELDVCDEAAVFDLCKTIRPAGIVHLASIDIHRCRSDPAECRRVNVSGAETAAQVSAHLGLPLLYVSTGAIFGGSFGESFDELSEPNPQNTYGETKVLAEAAIQKANPRSLIVRTGWLFGGGGGRFFDSLAEKIRSGEALRVSSDQTGSPTFVGDLLGGISELISNGVFGIRHVCNSGSVTAAEFVRETAKLLELEAQMISISINDSSVRRSASETLSTRYAPLRPWSEALADYLRSSRL